MIYFENTCVGHALQGHICVNDFIPSNLLQMLPQTSVVGGRFTLTAGSGAVSWSADDRGPGRQNVR